MNFLLKFIIILFSGALLWATNDFNLSKDITLYEKIKETNSTNTTVINVRKVLIEGFNFFMPSYLQVEPKEDFLDLALNYDLLHNNLSTSVKVRVILPSLERSLKKISKKNKTKTTTKTYTFKITPLLRLYNSVPTLVIRPSFTFSNSVYDIISSITKKFYFNETFYYYTFQNEWKESTTLTLNEAISIKNLVFRANKTLTSKEKSNFHHNLGFYYYDKFAKYIRIYGFVTGGEKKLSPFVYYYKLFFTYRHILFNKKYFYIEITPYLMASKEWDYTVKFFANASLHLKF